MSRFRTLLAWLIMVAIPLQGLAASSMLFCGMGAHHAPSEQGSQKKTVSQDTTKATGEHDHSKHVHAAPQKVQKSTEVQKSAATSAGKLPEASHKCGVCASCCHSIAIAEFPALVAFAPAPQADLIEPFVLIQARPAPVPDKPPRA